MNPAQAPQPRQCRYSARHQARLDAETSVKLDELARTFQRKRGAILRHVMQWGLDQSKGWTIAHSIPAAVHLVPMLLEPELLQRVHDAAASHGVSVAEWLHETMRRVTTNNFPASWRTGETVGRSHDSGYYDRKYQLRLDEATSHKLEALTRTFDRPAAEVIRQLILQARLEDFPKRWRIAVDERQDHHGGVP